MIVMLDARKMLVRRSLPIVALVACLVPAIGGCGGDGGTKDLRAQEVLSQVRVGMTKDQVRKALGAPASSFHTETGGTAEFLEYDSKDGTVAISIDRGTVSSARALGTDDKEKPQPSGPSTDAGSPAEDVPRQIGN